jgi:hypothetical protein
MGEFFAGRVSGSFAYRLRCEKWKVWVEVYKLAVKLRKTTGQINYERDF